jgi:Predicted integral membrane protein (DUF2275)/Putative zinc-finger
MDHNDIRHKLSEYLDGAISDKDKAEIELHLKSCTICSDALEELRKTIEQVRQIEEVEPPAWMTQKIMAKVRVEAEVKKSWYQQFFFPLAVKLPIQAVAVLFLAVTAYYVYQNINPTAKYSEAPLAKFEITKPAAPTLSPAPEPKMQGEAAAPGKKVPQAPQYKALDMKLEYEKPAPPAPLSKAGAPAPTTSAAPAVEAKKDAASGKQSFAPQAAAPAAMQDKAERSSGFVAARETKPSERALQRKEKSAVAEAGGIRLSLSVADMAAADKKVESIVRELKGTVIRREAGTDTRAIVVSLDAKILGTLQEKLGKLGTLKEKEIPSASSQGLLQVEIMLTSRP